MPAPQSVRNRQKLGMWVSRVCLFEMTSSFHRRTYSAEGDSLENNPHEFIELNLFDRRYPNVGEAWGSQYSSLPLFVVPHRALNFS